MPYLKPEDVGDGLSMEFLAGSVKTKPKKDGSTYEVFEMMVKRNDGQTATYDVFVKSAEYGGIYDPDSKNTIETGSQIMAFSNGDFVNWKVLPEGEKVLQEKQPSNYAQNKRDDALKDKDKSADAHDWKLGLAGMLQAYRAGGDFTEVARGKAEADAAWVRTRSQELSEMQL